MANNFKEINSAASYYKNPSLIDKKSKMMAISIDKSSINKKIKYGIAREVFERTGDPTKSKFLDKSRLIIVKSKDLLNWEKVSELKIKNIQKIIGKISYNNEFFIGLEDPDLYKINKTYHLFFTIAFKYKNKKGYEVHLGHARGKSLDKLKANPPSLIAHHSKLKGIYGFKEISIFPSKKYAITEGGKGVGGTKIILVKISAFKKRFKEIKTLLDPKNIKYKWCKGELSTGPIIEKLKINKKDYILTFINGREKKRKTRRGIFAIGLMLINKTTKSIDWVSQKPVISDPIAKGITFASDFVPINKNEGYLYAHVDDSFVRTYKINLKELKKLLPKKL